MTKQAFIGYDPGGVGNNAVALLLVEDRQPIRAALATVDGVDPLFSELAEALGDFVPSGVGIDSPLTWSGSESGWRVVDRELRGRYPAVQQSVFCTNSAYGSIVVQGPLFAERCRRLWPKIVVSETHPKILFHALSQQAYDFGPNMTDWLNGLIFPDGAGVTFQNDHEWDALISAWAVFMAAAPAADWEDLMELEGADALYRPVGDVRYFWPPAEVN